MQYIVDKSYSEPQNSYATSSVSAGNPSEAFLQIWNASSSYNDTGMPITQSRAIGSPPIWTSASKICGHLGQMPLDCMRWIKRDDDESESDRKHPSHYIFNTEFNPSLGADVGKETLALHSLLRGNGRALIVRNARYEASELYLLDPDCTSTVFIQDEGKPTGSKYHVWQDKTDGKYYTYLDADVFHVPGLSADGVTGYDTINVAANSIGGNIVSERKSIRMMKNDSAPSILIESPAGMFKTDSDAKQFLRDFKDAHSGDNQGSVGVLRNGMKASTLALSAAESQMIEQRKFGREDMALLFGVEQMLGIDKSVSYNSEEQRSKAYRVNCLGRWMTRWEIEAKRKLLSNSQRRADSHYFMWNDEILMQATLAERYEGYSKAIAARILNPNECRKREGYKPYKGGDTYENPNTTVVQPQSKQPGTKPGPTNAIRSHVEHIIGVEIKRITQFAENPSKFGTRINQFYDGWKDTISSMVSTLGGDSFLAAQWIEASVERVLLVSGESRVDNLRENIDKELKSWDIRIDNLVANIKELQA
jgi:HK97 family phage portal protein